MRPAVAFDGVWKKFRRGEHHDTLKDLLPSLARRVLGRTAARPDRDFWVLRDVSFEVAPGQALGIIGANGAGKSTTLKLLSRILRPTRGTSVVRGRMGALIEVAAGFHPDLTGRENIFLQGAIMGMPRADVIRKLDDIVAFAGVGGFVDTPVKRYSSGMNARLGFSIAAHLEPEVLIIDEVLSVGDMAFQRRCIDKMLEFKRTGVTIVFVSHDLQAVSRLCDRALLLNGSVGVLGPTMDVLKAYVTASASTAGGPSASGVSIEPDVLIDGSGRAGAAVEPGQQLSLTAEYGFGSDLTGVTFSFVVHRATDGLVVYDESVDQSSLGIETLRAGRRVRIQFVFEANLTRGHYHIELRVFHTSSQKFLADLATAASFTVIEDQSFSGVAHLDLRTRLETANETAALVTEPV